MPIRSTEDVFLDHLELARRADVGADLERNFSPDVVLLTSYGVFRGFDGMRRAAQLLEQQLGGSNYTYVNKLWDGELAFLEWTAETPTARVCDGADSYLVRGGRIVAMTIHYTVERTES